MRVQHLRRHDADLRGRRRARRRRLDLGPAAGPPTRPRSSSPGRWPARRRGSPTRWSGCTPRRLAGNDGTDKAARRQCGLTQLGGAAGVRTSGRPRFLPWPVEPREVLILCLPPSSGRWPGSRSPRSTTPTRSPCPCGARRSTRPRTSSSGPCSSSASSGGWCWFVLRHPLLDAVAAALVFTWLKLGWPGLVALVGVHRHWRWPGLPAVAGMVRPARRPGGAGLVAALVLPAPLEAAMTLAGLAPSYRGRVLVPVLAGVRAAGRGGPGDGAAGDRAGSRKRSPTGPSTWPMPSARNCAGSATPGRAW